MAVARRRLLAVACAAVIGFAASRAVAAENRDAAIERIERQIRDLQREVERLKRDAPGRGHRPSPPDTAVAADGADGADGADTAGSAAAPPRGVFPPAGTGSAASRAGGATAPPGAGGGSLPVGFTTTVPAPQPVLPVGSSAAPGQVAGYEPRGFFLRSESGEYSLRIGGYTQLDGRLFLPDEGDGPTSQFLVRRARLVLEGFLGPWLDFKLQPGFEGANPQLYDMFVDLKPFGPWAKIRVGKFKTPTGLERLQPARDLPLVERGAATNLVPIRDMGVQLWSVLWSGALGYEFALLDGAPDLTNPTGGFGGVTFSGRLFSQPFARSGVPALAGLGVGIAGSRGREQGSASAPALPTYRSFGQAAIFSYVDGSNLATTAIADGMASRWNPQLFWYAGPLGLEFEYVSSRTPVALDGIEDTLDNRGWAVTGSWLVTGDAAAWRGFVPRRPFEPWSANWSGGWGALEVAARYDTLVIDRDAFALGFADPGDSVSKEQGFGGGLNWSWNSNLKLSLDYYHTHFEGGATGGTGNRPTEDVFVGRLQVSL